MTTQLSPEDIAFIQKLHANSPQHGPALLSIGIADTNPNYKGQQFKLSPSAAQAFIQANADYKHVYGHDIPVASAYRDPQRNAALPNSSPTSNHLSGNSLDIDRSALSKVTPFLIAHGFSPLGGTYKGNSEDNHFDFKGGSSSAVVMPTDSPVEKLLSSNGKALTQPVVMPDLTPGPIDKGGHFQAVPSYVTSKIESAPSTFDLAASKKLQELQNEANQPGPGKVQPTQSLPTNPYDAVSDLSHYSPPPQNNAVPNQPGVLDSIGQFFLNAPNNIKNAIDTELKARAQEDPALRPISQYVDLLKAGGLGVAQLWNGAVTLPHDLLSSIPNGPQIPTGDWEKDLANKPVTQFAGGVLPWLLLPEAEGAKDLGAAAKIARTAGVGAAAGFIGTPGEGLQGRVGNAAINALLGGGVAGVHAGMDLAFPHKVAPSIEPDTGPPQSQPLPTTLELAQQEGGNPNITRAGWDAESAARAEQQRQDLQPGKIEFPQQDLRNPNPEIITPGGGNFSGQPVEPPAQPKDLILNQPQDTSAQLQIAPGLPQGRDLSAPPIPVGEDIPTKSAEESANVFQQATEDQQAAEQLMQEAMLMRQQAERQMILNSPTETTHLADAQIANGQRLRLLQDQLDAEGTLSHPDAAELMQRQELIDKLQQARENERQATDLYHQQQQPTPRSELPPPNYDLKVPTEPFTGTPLKTAGELALEKSNSDLVHGEPVDLAVNKQASDLSRTTVPNDLSAGQSRILQSSADELPKSKVLELPQRTKGGTPFEIVGPNGQPIKSYLAEHQPAVTKLPEGGEVLSKGLSGAQLEKAISQVKGEASKAGGQISSYADALAFLKRTGRTEEANHLENIWNAGLRGETVKFDYNSLKSGRTENATREVNPFAVEMRSISPQTEVRNLRAQLGSDEAVRSNLIERLQKQGVDVSGNESRLPGNQAANSKVLNALAGKLKEANPDEFTHVYGHSHNFGETSVKAEGSERGYRMDTITRSSLTGKAQEIPRTQYGNEIGHAQEFINHIMNDKTTPPQLKKAIQKLGSGKITRNSVKEIRNYVDSLTENKRQEFLERC